MANKVWGLIMEIWKDIPGTDYMVSSIGRVYARHRFVRTKAVNGVWSYRVLGGYLMNCGVNDCGYMRVSLSFGDGKSKPALVHRLVAKAFLGDGHTDESVNHIDGDKLNNSVENLEWATLSENTRKAWQTGLCIDARKPVRNINTGEVFDSCKSAAKHYGKAPSGITSVCKGNQKTFAGFHWEYA